MNFSKNPRSVTWACASLQCRACSSQWEAQRCPSRSRLDPRPLASPHCCHLHFLLKFLPVKSKKMIKNSVSIQIIIFMCDGEENTTARYYWSDSSFVRKLPMKVMNREIQKRWNFQNNSVKPTFLLLLLLLLLFLLLLLIFIFLVFVLVLLLSSSGISVRNHMPRSRVLRLTLLLLLLIRLLSVFVLLLFWLVFLIICKK